MNADSLARALDAWKGTYLVSEEDRCVNLRARDVVCTRCRDACPQKVLALDADTVDVGDDCTDCGACVPACPAGVFRLIGFDPERVATAAAGCRKVHLHCVASRDDGGGIVIPCHHVADGRLAAALAAEGARTIVLHGLDGCADCPKGNAEGVIAETEKTLRRWLDEAAPVVRRAAAGESAPEKEQQREDQVRTDRRGFLRMTGLRMAAGTAWIVPLADEEESAVPASPFRQEGMTGGKPVPYAEALARRAAALAWREGVVLPWFRRTFAEACNACMVCAWRCPTGALAGEETTNERRIQFTSAACTNCGLCVRICPQEAIRAEAADDVTGISVPQLLLHRAVKECGRCGRSFMVGEEAVELCPACRNEHEMDEEWLVMLGG
jgi:ferredoxin